MKVKFLVAVWGQGYIEELMRVSVPSYLAEGNLPYLAEHSDLEILIMTSAASLPAFEREPAFDALKSVCNIRFINIDDLITTGTYGVTLTLAYARGIADSGTEQAGTCFIFMNADFVLADGGFRTLVRLLQNGERCILAPTLRGTSEKALPILAQAMDRNRNVLAIEPRKLVKVALENLHPTVAAKTIAQGIATCKTHNQLYWQIDKATLLARHHLIFMLAIVPETPLGPVSSYCDYGFVPEMVPSGKFRILGDSDDLFIFELQPKDQESELLYCGVSTVKAVANELSVWATREHRQFAHHDVVFHADDVPTNIDDWSALATEFIAQVHANMASSGVAHRGHPYWQLGVQAWLQSHKAVGGQEPAAPPPELALAADSNGLTEQHPYNDGANNPNALARAYIALVKYIRRRAGQMPNVSIWHHSWLDSRLLLDWSKQIDSPAAPKGLKIHQPGSIIQNSFDQSASIEQIEIGQHSERRVDLHRKYDHILVEVPMDELQLGRKYFEMAATYLAPGGTISIFVQIPHHKLGLNSISFHLATSITDFLPNDWMNYDISARYAGGGTQNLLRILQGACLRRLWPRRFRDIPGWIGAVLAWPAIACLMAGINFRMRHANEHCSPFCSSAMVTFRQRGRPFPSSKLR